MSVMPETSHPDSVAPVSALALKNMLERLSVPARFGWSVAEICRLAAPQK